MTPDREDRIRKMIKDYKEGMFGRVTEIRWSSLHEDLLSEIDSLRSRLADLEAKNRWIPVSEIVPPMDGDTVILIRNGNMVLTAYFDLEADDPNYPWKTEDSTAYHHKNWPTHWRPLPEGPEEKE